MSNLRLMDPIAGDPFEVAMRRFFTPDLFESDMTPQRMPVDVAERDGIYEVKADLPGIKKENINVRVDGNVVQIDAQGAPGETAPGTTRMLRRERFQGNITRTFSMAEDIDEAKVQARYMDGVLTLELPKKASSAARRIAVQ